MPTAIDNHCLTDGRSLKSGTERSEVRRIVPPFITGKKITLGNAPAK